MNRQVPAPSAAAWLFDLTHIGAPMFVVLRQDEAEARACFGVQLVELGVVADFGEAAAALAEANVQHVGVIW
jgi:hypothetical protein